MNRLYLLIVLSSIFLYAFADAADVSNVTAYQEVQKIIIEYDLAQPNEITPYVSINSGENVKLTNITGDVGANVTAGHKRIVWDVLSQYEKFDYTNVLFSIETSITSVHDICGNTYPVVKIGDQWWTAENIRCNKYDTSSEAYKAGRYTIPTSEKDTYKPYYTNATDVTKWKSTDYSGNLRKEHIAKLGYLYNWAAAVGLENGKTQSSAFISNRQGICPNGWHVPTRSEWSTLFVALGGGGDVGLKMKTKSGWYQHGNGTNVYGFAALPSGFSVGNSIDFVGYGVIFWTASPVEDDKGDAYINYLGYSYDILKDGNDYKYYGQSVRCLRN